MNQTSSPIISDYTRNSKSKNIEYEFADGEHITITPDDYAADTARMGRPAPEYGEMKKLSDADYHRQKLNDYNTTHLNWNIEWAEQKGLCAVPSPERIIVAQIEAEELRRKREHRLELAKKALDSLTEVQRRRYVLHVGYGLTLREIAELDGVNHSKIQESIRAAEKKIKKVVDES